MNEKQIDERIRQILARADMDPDDAKPDAYEIDEAAYAPRDEENRYRVYRVVRRDVERRAESERIFGHPGASIPTVKDGLALLATSPTISGIGMAVGCLLEEGEVTPEDRIGILDAPLEDVPGRWLLNPFALGRQS